MLTIILIVLIILLLSGGLYAPITQPYNNVVWIVLVILCVLLLLHLVGMLPLPAGRLP